MRYLKTPLPATIPITGIAMLAACAGTPPGTRCTISRTRPMHLTPMVRLATPFPSIGWHHNALPSSVTACFRVDADGDTRDISITRVSVPGTGDKKVDHEIRVALGATVKRAVKDSKFYPAKVHGKRVESPPVCEDYRFTREHP